MNRVLVVLPAVAWGGVHAFAATLNAPMLKRGWQWQVAIPEEAAEVRDRLTGYGVEVIPVPMGRIRKSVSGTLHTIFAAPKQLRHLSKIARERKITVVQAVGAHHYHGAAVAKSIGRPLVWQIHSDILQPPWRGLAASLIQRASDCIMTNGISVARTFWGRGDLGEGHFVFYAPVDPTLFKPDQATRSEMRRALGVTEDVMLVGTLGNRIWQKNHELLIEVAARLTDLHPKLKFIVLGAPGTTYAEEYRRGVEVPAAELSSRFPGYVTILDPRREVAAHLNALDAFVMTSHAEGVPIALFEALSTGLPAVSTAVGSISEVLAEGETGHLVPAGDAAGIAERIRDLYHDRQHLSEMGVRARKSILEKFSIDEIASTHAAAYEYAMTKKRSRS